MRPGRLSQAPRRLPGDAGGDGLTPVQRRVLDELRATGISIVPFAELVGNAPLWEELRADMDAFAAWAEERLAASGRGGKKTFLIRRYERGKSKLPLEPAILPSNGPWLRFAASDALLGVVNAYREAMCKLVDFDQWYTVPVGDTHEREASQRWHRDPEDQHVVKVFLYFSDVDEEAGPLEYVRDSAAGGRYGDLWPWGKGSPRYPPQDELERAIPRDARVSATGPVGTLVVCDTSGFHRGGYARSKPRILSTHTYVNKKITADRPERRKFQVDWQNGELSEQARFALT